MFLILKSGLFGFFLFILFFNLKEWNKAVKKAVKPKKN